MPSTRGTRVIRGDPRLSDLLDEVVYVDVDLGHDVSTAGPAYLARFFSTFPSSGRSSRRPHDLPPRSGAARGLVLVAVGDPRPSRRPVAPRRDEAGSRRGRTRARNASERGLGK